MAENNFDLEERLASLEKQFDGVCKKLDRMERTLDMLCEQNDDSDHVFTDDLK